MYFRTVLLTADNLLDDPRALKQLKHSLGSLNNFKRKRFASMIGNSLTYVDVQTKAGIFLKRKPGLKIDHSRIEKVLVRIICGLYFREFGTPVERDLNVIAKIDQYSVKSNTLAKESCFQPIRWAADEMFGYTFARAIDKPAASVWLGTFYQRISFFGFTGVSE